MGGVRITKTYDSLLELKDAGALTASAACQVDSAAKVLDIGSGGVEGDIIIDVSAIEVNSDDEKYIIGAQISDSADFSSGVYEIASITLGAAGSTLGDNLAGDTEMGIGRWVLPFQNKIANNVAKRYLRLYVTISGTIATGINFTAYLGKKAV